MTSTSSPRRPRLPRTTAVRHGIESVMAEAAVLWPCRPATPNAHPGSSAQVAGGGFAQCRTTSTGCSPCQDDRGGGRSSAYTDIGGGHDADGAYAGRCVVNAGAVVFAGVVDDYLWRAAVVSADARRDDWRAAADAAYRRLDAPWWRRRVSAPTSRRGVPVAAPRASDRGARSRCGGCRARRCGRSVRPGEARLVPDMKGLHYLHALLQRPGARSARRRCPRWPPDTARRSSEPDAGERLDRRALTAYRNDCGRSTRSSTRRKSWEDPARAERIEAEREALLRELAGATGLGGRARTMRRDRRAGPGRGTQGDRSRARPHRRRGPGDGPALRRTVHTGSVVPVRAGPGHAGRLAALTQRRS